MQLKIDKPQSDAVDSSAQFEQQCDETKQNLLHKRANDKQAQPKQTGLPQTKQIEGRSWGLFDLIEMQTEFALCQSMARSKTLTIMVCLGVLGYGGFILFLFKMAS